MRDMADLDAVHLGLDENEADIAEELQDFDSFDTRSEASKSRAGSMASDSEPSISSVSTAPSSTRSSSKRVSKSKSKGNNKAAKESSSTKSKSANTVTTSSSSGAATASTSKGKTSKKSSKRSASPGDLNGKKKKSSHSSSGSESSKLKSKVLETDDKSNSKSQDSEERETNIKKSREKNKKTNSSAITSAAASVAASLADAGNKSDLSDAEDVKPKLLPALESDSESSDSDSGTQHKRNGGGTRGKAALSQNSNSKDSSPEREAQRSYDYMTKINYLFRDTRFFLIKSNNSDNVQLSKSKSVWATLPQNDANLTQAFKEARNVLLIFSVNESGKFAGFARMAAPSRRDIPQVAWVLPPSISPKALSGVIELDWICRKDLSFNSTLHLHNSWNEGKPVKIGRDGQEIEPKIGAELCRLFPEDDQIELTPILRKSKEIARIMREKGIHVIYKAPRSLSTRGHGGGRGNSQLGPMRHKRSYGHNAPHHHQHQQRPYHRHHHHHHGMGMQGNGGGGGSGGFKRSGSPYRQMGSGGGSSSAEMPSPAWERYMSSAAAAEAYVADYIRNMHGQLPPLPFVPPFGQLPMASSAGAAGALPPGAPASMYEQLPPPVRYYDGPGAPPLPDYPPPQPMRPPPPGFDKVPSYEDFAAWKNAGLPTVAAPPGFPNVYAANGGGGSIASGGAIGGATLPSMSAGNRDSNNSSGLGGRRREYGGGNRSGGGGGGSSRQFRGDRGGGRSSYRDGRR